MNITRLRPLAGECVSLAEARKRSPIHRPETLLILLKVAMALAFTSWMALLNNFGFEAAGIDGSEIGWLHTIREIPGLLAVSVLLLLLLMREQSVALLSLFLLGGAVAITGYFPNFWGLLLVTAIGSVGFHYHESISQSLQLQWLSKSRAPKVLARIVAAGSAASLVAYGFIIFASGWFDIPYEWLYLIPGAASMILTGFCAFFYPAFAEKEQQHRKIILRRRYWLYYALVLVGGGRRQIFVVFAAFMMVERFGFALYELTAILAINYVFNLIAAPLMGRVISYWGERVALTVEYIGLIGIFCAYAMVESAWIAAVLFILDHLFFALSFAHKTYLQKIAHARDLASTAAVAFTINHIAAVFLPAILGYIYLHSPGYVFFFGAGLAVVSLILARLCPKNPQPGKETILAKG